jgi:hypothetical protein
MLVIVERRQFLARSSSSASCLVKFFGLKHI